MTVMYSEDHLWVRLESGSRATLGISRQAAEEVGEITFVELPALGTPLSPGDVLCVMESVKTAADVTTPIGGIVCEVNRLLDEKPRWVNDSPEETGWLCRLEQVDQAQVQGLMNREQYLAFVDAHISP